MSIPRTSIVYFGLFATCVAYCTYYIIESEKTTSELYFAKTTQQVRWNPISFPIERILNSNHEEVQELLDRYSLVKPSSLSAKCHRLVCLAALKEYRHNGELLTEELSELIDTSVKDSKVFASPGIFIQTRYGPVVRKIDLLDRSYDAIAELHNDQLLSALAESGVPVRDRLGDNQSSEISITSLLEASRKCFIVKHEPYWSVIAYCHYLPNCDTWVNRFGDSVSLDDVCRELLRKEYEDSACYGSHRLYCIALLLQLDKSTNASALNNNTANLASGTLESFSRKLERCQRPDGAWDENGLNSSAVEKLPQMNELVSVTAHHLDWIAYAPARLRPEEAVLAKAVRFLLRSLHHMSTDELLENYCAVSHAVRAISNLCDESSISLNSFSE